MQISVVTISYRPGAAILRTAASVASQTGCDLEWLVIDGGSDDGTVERLQNLARHPDVLLSEADRGIAHAFNKGTELATGRAILYLNAGDEFAAPDALVKLQTAWSRGRWVTGGAEVIDADGRLLYTRTPISMHPLRLVTSGCRIWHAATLLETCLVRELGGYDESFCCSMDYELWLRLFARGIFPQTSPDVCARFHLGGISGNHLRRSLEDRRARQRHGLSPGPLGEAWLGALAWAKAATQPIARARWLYRSKELLRL